MPRDLSVHFASFFAEATTTRRFLLENGPFLAATTVNNLMLRKSFLSLLGLTWASAANADWALNMPRGITELSAETYDLHMMVFWWCVAIG
ncbi:MAG: hypothetical protein GQ577_05850, partial [Woeseiaceae bacterium]|nr:hypothetical protein [Woeseiaceae bacterium]